MDKKPRARRAYPSWVSEKFPQPKKYPFKDTNRYIEVPKKSESKLSPTEYYDKRKKEAIKKVLIHEW